MKSLKYFLIALISFACNPANNKSDFNPRYSPVVEDRITRVINNLQVKTDWNGVYENKTLADRMKFYHTPGVSIAVINDGKIEWARGFGLRDEKNDSVDINTLFMAGSVSKPIFALAVMRLKEKEIIDLDKDVNEYLKTWQVPPVKDWKPKITLRQLLGHTAGVTVGGFEGYSITDTIPTIQQTLNGEPPANNHPVRVNILPGSVLRYAGGGTTVAQLTIMDILGKPFPEIMREELFDPLNLKLSTYEQPLPKQLQNNFSTGFPNKGIPVEGKFHVYPEMGAAGLWSTPSELAAMLVEVQKAVNNESIIFQSETIEEMLTPQKITPSIGIGFFQQGKGDSMRFFHSGWDEGFISTAVAYKNSGKGAVIMVNSNEGFAMLDEIISAIAIEYQWQDFIPVFSKDASIDPDEIKKYKGKYFDSDNTEFTIDNLSNSFYLIYQNQNPLPITKKQDGSFRNDLFNFSIKFANDTLIFSQEQVEKVYVKKSE